MPRIYKRKTQRGSSGPDAIREALSAIRSGMELKTAAREYGVPAKTLRRHRDGKVHTPGCLGRFKPDLDEYENVLVGHIQTMERALFGLTPMDVRRLAFDFAEKLEVNHRFNKSTKLAGKDWLRGFLERHPQLSIRKPEATSLARAIGFNRGQVNIFFDVYKDILTAHDYSPTRVWNMDETGITNVQTPSKIVASKGARDVGRMTSGERGKLVTVLCAKSAAGSYIPPMFIFPRKRMAEGLMANAPAGSIGVCTDNGWTDGNMFMKWLQHFTTITKPSPQEKHLIILDGHHSHKTLAVIEYARTNGIELVTLPPHCTHKMQPLDRTLFKALKSAYNSASDTWMVAHKGQRISFFDMAGIFATAYNKTATVEKAVNGFRVCGLWPYNNQIFSDEDFVAAELTNEAQPASNTTANPSTTAVTTAVTSQSTATTGGAMSAATIAATTTTTAGISMVSTSATPTTSTTTTRPTSNVSAVTTATNAETNKTAAINVGVTIAKDTTSADAGCSSQRAKCLLASLTTPVKAVKARQRKRKAERATHLTSSPFKKMLQEKEKSKGKGKKTAQKSKKETEAKKKQETKDSGDEEWPGLFRDRQQVT